MWEESIRLELLKAGIIKATDTYKATNDPKSFDRIYLDLRLEFPTLSEQEIWKLIGLCVKLR